MMEASSAHAAKAPRRTTERATGTLDAGTVKPATADDQSTAKAKDVTGGDADSVAPTKPDHGPADSSGAAASPTSTPVAAEARAPSTTVTDETLIKAGKSGAQLRVLGDAVPDQVGSTDHGAPQPQARTVQVGHAKESQEVHPSARQPVGDSEHAAGGASTSAQKVAATPGQRFVLAGADGHLRAGAARAKPRAGYIDVVIHGSTDHFWLVRENVDIPVDHRALAKYLQKHDLHAQKIRLIACEAGKSRFAVAHDLANKLGMEVLAPSDTAWINGDGAVGVGAKDRNTGDWRTFKPQHTAPKGRAVRLPDVEPEPMRAVDGSEIDGPVAVAAPRFDKRARIGASDLTELGVRAGVKIEIDSTLDNGVELHADIAAGFAGYRVETSRIGVGKHALLADVQTHIALLPQMRRYNSLLAQVKAIWTKLFKKGVQAPRYAEGTRGHFTQVEIQKLEAQLAQRHAEETSGLVDAVTLRDEVKFLEGALAYHQDILKGMIEVGDLHDVADGVIAGPDIGKSTRAAHAQGYKLPGDPGSNVAGDPAHYYYRRAKGNAATFELAVKPSAPTEAPTYRARVVDDKFIALEDRGGQTPSVALAPALASVHVVAALRQTEGFGGYAEMLAAEGIASAAVIDAAVATLRGRKQQAGKVVTVAWLRHAVKDYFRARVEARLVDAQLSNTASYVQAQRMVAGLSASDRGNLMEVWYRARYAPAGQAHQHHQVTRTSGDNKGLVETRVTDLVVGREAREVKSGKEPIDQDQFAAYVDVLEQRKKGQAAPFDKLRYVFTNPEGAIANLEFFAKAMRDISIQDKLAVEVFDAQGKRHIITTPKEALTVLATLKVEK